jgi:hypothetical protein
MISLCLLSHVWSSLCHENLSFNKHVRNDLGAGGCWDTTGIVENSVMVAEENLHCSYLDGTEDIAWDNSNYCSRHLIKMGQF